MSWKDILKKIISPREFLQGFADRLGGEVKRQVKRMSRKRTSRNSDFFELHFDGGYIKIDREPHKNLYKVNVNGKHNTTDIGTLDRLTSWVESELGL